MNSSDRWMEGDRNLVTAFLPELDQLIDEGLVTKEKVRVIIVRHSEAKKNQANPS
jgi:hypothetical protein